MTAQFADSKGEIIRSYVYRLRFPQQLAEKILAKAREIGELAYYAGERIGGNRFEFVVSYASVERTTAHRDRIDFSLYERHAVGWAERS